MRLLVAALIVLKSTLMFANSGDTLNGTVLAIGASAKILQELSDELHKRGYVCETFNEYGDMDLIQNTFKERYFDVVAFGRALTVEDKKQLTGFFQRTNPQVQTVEGWAPIIPLLLDQIEAASNQRFMRNNKLPQVELTKLSSNEIEVGVPVSKSIVVTFYHLNWFYRRTIKIIYNAMGNVDNKQKIRLPRKSGQRFISVKVEGEVIGVFNL